MNKISFIIPAYNEEKHIYENLLELSMFCDKYVPDYEVIVVDDGSIDGTYEKIQKLKSGRLRAIRLPLNIGKGYALCQGVNMARGNLITFIDADFDLDPKMIKRFVTLLDESGADLVIGSKRHPHSKVDYPWMRRFLSRCYNVFIRFLFGLRISDTQSGFKLVRKEVLQKILPAVLVKKYAFDLELLAIANRLGYRIVEAPVEVRYHNNSNVDWRSVWSIFVDTCAVFYRMSIVRYYDKKLKKD